MKGIDYSKITDNPKVVELLEKRNDIEKQIKDIEKMALVNYELEVLGIDDEDELSTKTILDVVNVGGFEFLEDFDPQIKEVGYENYSYTPEQVIQRLDAFKEYLNQNK